jgi:bidirectional [NiFe] hydrogenase diaphorase subunit
MVMSIRLTINNVPVTAQPGEYVINVARRNGFSIPSLCSHEAVEPIGACRLCLVELSANGNTTLTSSCNVLVQEGISVITDSQLIRKQRAMNIELLLARAPRSETLRRLAAEYGIFRSRFTLRDENGLQNCILCELCNRVCAQLGHNALSVIGRGDSKRIGPPFDQPAATCVGCASCVSVCPTRCIPLEETKTTRTIWGHTFKYILCKVCHGPVITDENYRHALAYAGLPEDYYDVCESCKQALNAEHFSSLVR